MAVMEQLGGPETWKQRVCYEGRWMIEMAFYAIKRVFGEYVMARSFPNMVGEMLLKASPPSNAYQGLKQNINPGKEYQKQQSCAPMKRSPSALLCSAFQPTLRCYSFHLLKL
jgi:hypothetical protein